MPGEKLYNLNFNILTYIWVKISYHLNLNILTYIWVHISIWASKYSCIQHKLYFDFIVTWSKSCDCSTTILQTTTLIQISCSFCWAQGFFVPRNINSLTETYLTDWMALDSSGQRSGLESIIIFLYHLNIYEIHKYCNMGQ